ncbi:MAG: TIR domain-containing protein [Lachnospiraceae bacterium]|nr:TIR domain-containing protein [Lachnospiraceae bacterium]
MSDKVVEYSAFISYKHGDLDSFVAENLHKAIETFHIPKNIQKATGKKQMERVFRDKEELPISSNLSDNISSALQHSEYLIVICSPRTPESYWVQKEIETFIGMHDRDHVLAVLIEGEPEESFPEMLRYAEKVHKQQDGTLQVERIPVEPLAADLRGENKAEVKKKLKTEILRIMAPLLNCSYDDLKQRHRERKMRRAISICAALSACFLAFGIYSMYNTMRINQEYRVKQINQSRYLAETSQRLLNEGDRELAIKIALEALPEYEGSKDRPYVPEAEYALTEALGTYANGTEFFPSTQLECNGEVQELITSPDNTLIAARDNMNQVYVWNVESLEQLVHIESVYDENYRMETVYNVQFNCKNQLLYRTEAKLICWDVVNNAEIWNLEIGDGSSDVVMSSDSSMIAVKVNGEILVLDAITGKEILANNQVQPNRYWTFSPDNQFLAIDANDETTFKIAILEIATNNVTYIEKPEWVNAMISDIEFVGKKDIIVTVWENNSDILTDEGFRAKFNTETQEQLWLMQDNATDLDVYFGAEDKAYNNPIVITDSGSSIVYIDQTTGAKESNEMALSIADIHLLSENQVLVVGRDGEIVVTVLGQDYVSNWGQVGCGRGVSDIVFAQSSIFMRPVQSNKIIVCRVETGGSYHVCMNDEETRTAKVSPDALYIVLENLGKIKIVESENFAVIGEYSDIANYWFVEETGELIFLDSERCIRRIDVSTGTELERLEIARDLFTASNHCYTDNGAWMAYTDGVSSTIVVNTRDLTETYAIDNLSMKQMRLSMDGKYLVGISENGRIDAYEVQTGKQTVVPDYGYGVINLATATSGNTIAVAHHHDWYATWGTDNVIRVVEIPTGKTLAQFELPAADQTILAFTEDDSMIMACGLDEKVTFYNIEEKAIVKQIDVENAEFQEVIFEPEDELCIMRETYGAYILTTKDNDYSIIAYIPSYRAIDMSRNMIYTDNSIDGLVSFEYKDLTSLLLEANEFINYETLTPLEKLTYHVE